MSRSPVIVLLAAVVGAVLLVSFVPKRNSDEPVSFPVDRPPVRGLLRVATFGERAVAEAPSAFVTSFVNGTDYDGMEDNDLRGFLDGTFRYAWNQATQVHVRFGRRERSPRYGEFELMRVVQRWDGIELPPHSKVERATLSLTVEKGPERPMRVMLYAVNHEWGPGQGGRNGDNASPPVRGEVWWNDRTFEEDSWGLPGAGFASDVAPEADTPEMPLAEAPYDPSRPEIVFDSPSLARYASRRIGERLPLLFLLKLSDFQEDLPGSLVTVWSGNHGEPRNTARRPKLTLTWSSQAQLDMVERRVFLEHGRSYGLPALDSSGAAWIAWSFEAEGDGATPTLQFRDEAGDATWIRLATIATTKGERTGLRLLASQDPLVLGGEFFTEFSDTWVRTAAPEEQRVEWVFVSPTGIVHEAPVDYVGDYRWQVRFTPDELGPWSYRWSHRFTPAGFESPPGAFDVVLGDSDNALEQLKLMRDALSAFDGKPPKPVRRSWRTRFSRLERAVMQQQTAESFPDSEARRLLLEIRAAMGQPVPDPIPIKANDPHPWAK